MRCDARLFGARQLSATILALLCLATSPLAAREAEPASRPRASGTKASKKQPGRPPMRPSAHDAGPPPGMGGPATAPASSSQPKPHESGMIDAATSALPIAPREKLRAPPQRDAQHRAAMRACAQEWREMRQADATGDEIWRNFWEDCAKRRGGPASPPSP
jgi:hypothetical protein